VQVAALLVPGTQHDALRCLAVHLQIVYAGSVGVAVDHAAHARGAERRGHRAGIHVHDVRHGARGMTPAAGAHLVRQRLALRARQREEAALPVGRAHDAA
jgi:hypothetical protein